MFKDVVGATYNDFMFSNLVRYGKLSREEAMERCEKEGELSLHRFKKACKTLNIPHDLFDINPKA